MALRGIKVAAWGLLFMTGQSAVTQVRATESTHHGVVTLVAKAALKPTELIVTYRVLNGTGGPVVVWDQMIDYDGLGEKIDPYGAYVFWDDPDGIRLVRAQLQLPPGIDVYKKEIPYARTIAAHASVEGTIHLPLPLQEGSPFYSPPEFWNVVVCNRLRLLVGWREVLPGMNVKPVTLQGVAVESLQGKWDAPAQRLLETTVDLSTRLKVRTDAFDRSLPMR